MRMTAAKQLCIVNMFMVHVMAQNQTVALTYTHLYSPTPDADKKNIMEMLNQVSDSQPANDVMMSPSLDFDEALAATMLAETPLAETLTDDDVQAVKGLL
jgi:hypothetical protein